VIGNRMRHLHRLVGVLILAQAHLNVEDRPDFELSGSRGALLRLSPLRTVQASCKAHGSSLINVLCRTRFLSVQTKAVDLVVAGGVDQYTIVGPIRSAL
jgi:hypothetical protein